MSLMRVLDTLETDRLLLRRSTVGEAAIYRRLWTERDPRVPPHRRIDSEGRPTVEDIAAQSGIRTRAREGQCALCRSKPAGYEDTIRPIPPP